MQLVHQLEAVSPAVQPGLQPLPLPPLRSRPAFTSC